VVDGLLEQEVAAEFVQSRQDLDAVGTFDPVEVDALPTRLAQRTLEHLMLVGISIALGIATAIPLGILAAGSRAGSAIALTFASVVQTIPSLALLALLVTVVGRTGPLPAIVALWLYSLLPIVRNTHAGLTGIATPVRESAEALGLTWWQRLTRVELPLALPSILAGIKTSTVITIGFATLGALVNAGGYGQPIVSGLRRLDNSLILEGAIPAAAMALLAQVLLDWTGRRVTSRGLQA
jgi:osmoprotectant transport system permease protein